MSMRYFEFREGKANKFWEIRTNALHCTYTVRYGNIGTKGRQTFKDFYPDSTKMIEQASELIAEKAGKGYVEKDMFARAMASLASASQAVTNLEEARHLNRTIPWDLTSVPTQFPNLERGGLAWRFLVDEVPYMEVDRRKSMMKGPFFITEEYPTPKTEDGELMVPIIQADLRELSKLRGLPLGDGLFQAWWTWNDNQCRVIPRKVVDEQEPLPFPMEIDAFPDNDRCHIEDWMSPETFFGEGRDDKERVVPVILGYSDPFICIDCEPENATWEQIVLDREDETDTSEPAEYSNLIKVLEKITSGHPSCDHAFGSNHASDERPLNMTEDVLFYFGDEYFGGFGDVGCLHVMYGLKKGAPFFYLNF
jgi:predicted DNA-binding WGR domain protein